MTPVAAGLVDVALTLLQVGLSREMIVGKVREMEDGGASPDQITNALKQMAQEREAAAQAKLDRM